MAVALLLLLLLLYDLENPALLSPYLLTSFSFVPLIFSKTSDLMHGQRYRVKKSPNQAKSRRDEERENASVWNEMHVDASKTSMEVFLALLKHS